MPSLQNDLYCMYVLSAELVIVHKQKINYYHCYYCYYIKYFGVKRFWFVTVGVLLGLMYVLVPVMKLVTIFFCSV